MSCDDAIHNVVMLGGSCFTVCFCHHRHGECVCNWIVTGSVNENGRWRKCAPTNMETCIVLLAEMKFFKCSDAYKQGGSNDTPGH